MNKNDLRPDEVEAVAALEAILIEGEPAGTTCEVIAFRDKHGGLRIAEISWLHGNGGSSVMRSAGEAGNLILRAEDFVLNFHEQPFRPEGWDSDIDEKADAEGRLRDALAE